jgi:hypothetical protein
VYRFDPHEWRPQRSRLGEMRVRVEMTGEAFRQTVEKARFG